MPQAWCAEPLQPLRDNVSQYVVQEAAWQPSFQLLRGCAGDEDGAAIEMAFSKKKVEERKEWLSAYTEGTFLDNTAVAISYSDFVHKASNQSSAWQPASHSHRL